MEILRGEITKVTVDALVKAANTSFLAEPVSRVQFTGRWKSDMDDCRTIIAKQRRCKESEAVKTTAGNLNGRFVIHTVGPVSHR
ncbi:MAG: macro domain-containing protein [Chryseolinea sp.]